MEANRTAALEFLQQARRLSNRGNDEEAMKLVNKSLKLFDTDDGRELKKYFERFGPHSAAAATVARTLTPGTTYYEVMKLKASASAKEVRKAYKQLSLEVHPDRNHARGAEDAFKRLSEAFGVLGDKRARANYDAELRGGGGASYGGKTYGPGGYSTGGSSSSSAPPRHPHPPPPPQQQKGGYGGYGGGYGGGGGSERDVSFEALQRENASLRTELHRRRTAETQAGVEAHQRQREAKAACEELNSLRRRAAESERLRREEVSAAHEQGFKDAKSAMDSLGERLAASEQKGAALKKELHAQRAALDEARAESDAVTAAVNALLNRLEQQRGGATSPPVGSAHAGAAPVTVVGAKVGARELIMRLAATLAADVGGSLRRVRSGAGPGGAPTPPRPKTAHTPSQGDTMSTRAAGFKTMAMLRAEAVAARRERDLGGGHHPGSKVGGGSPGHSHRADSIRV